MHRRELLLTLCAAGAAGATVVATRPAAAAAPVRATSITHGFHAMMTAKPGKGDELVELLFSAPSYDNDDCLVFLIGRSAANSDVVFVTEGWRSREAHARFFESDVAQAYVAKFGPLVEGDSTYLDEVPLGGKAILS